MLAALLFLICIATVVFASKTNGKNIQYADQRESARIKYSFQTFQNQLGETQYNTENVGFIWGNPQAAHEISLYVSISCSYCDRAIKEMRRLTEIYPNFCYRLIFSVQSDNLEDKPNIVVRHFLNLYKTMNKNGFFDMLDIWYKKLNKNPEAFQIAFPAQRPQQNPTTEMDTIYQFNQQTNINYTPAILLDGRLLSQLYTYMDIYGILRTLYAEE